MADSFALAATIALIASAALYVLPGWAVLSVLWRGGRLGLAEQFALALGIGIALPPLLLEASRLVGLRWSTWTVVAYLALSALVLIVQARRRKISADSPRAPFSVFDPDFVAFAALLALTLAACAMRLVAVRDLPVGLWGDSLHHTMMAQLLVDNGGLFDSWAPYAPLTTFTYHFGFHANVAFAHWLSDIPVAKALLYSGQLLSAASIPLAYLLTSRLLVARTSATSAPSLVPILAGLWAAALVGFYNLLPAWLFNWGRYTQLAGQLVLVVVLVCWMETLEFRPASAPKSVARSPTLRLVILAAGMTACLMLTHYIVTAFAAVCVGIYVVALLVRDARPRAMARLIGLSAAIAALALALALPWLLNTASGYLAFNAGQFVSGDVGARRIAEYSALNPITPFFLKGPLVALAAVGLLIALAQRRWRMALAAIWSAALVFTATPQVLGLPGAGVIDTLTAYVALYVTVTPLAGYAIGWAQNWLGQRLSRARTSDAASARLRRAPIVTGGVAMAGLVVFAFSWQPALADLNYQLFTNADARAMDWVRANTPDDAKFFVNAFPAYGGTLVAGNDGGWWLKFLTGRDTNLPPLTYGSEKARSVEERFAIGRLAESVRGKPLTDLSPTRLDLTTPSALGILRAQGFTHVYVGSHLNPTPAQADAIDAAALRASPNFRRVYARDGVEIFELSRAADAPRDKRGAITIAKA